MKEDVYNKDYQSREFVSDIDPQSPKKNPTFLTVLLIGLCVLLVCSLSYDNIIKPYIKRSKQQTEKPVLSSPQESEEVAPIVEEEKTTVEDDANSLNVKEEPIHREYASTSEQAEYKESTASIQSIEEITPNVKGNTSTIQAEKRKEEKQGVQSVSKDESGLSNSDLLEKKTHASVVKQAQRAGVSTEGSTSEILDRITHASVVKQAQRAGVSTEGTTSEIMDRISRKQLEKMNW